MASYEKVTGMRPVEDLIEHPKNPRKGNVDSIRTSLEENGQFKPIVVQKSTGYILAGNHTFLAAQELGWDEMMVTTIDVDDELAKRIMLADNKTADGSEYDNAVLIDLLQELDDLTGTGYDGADLEMMMRAEARALESVDHVVSVDDFDPYEKIEVAEKIAVYRDRGKWNVETVREPEQIEKLEEAKYEDETDWEAAAYDSHKPGLLINPYAVFELGELPYDWPKLDMEMLVEDLPCMDNAKWKCWDGKRDVDLDKSDQWYLWNYGTKSHHGMPYERALMSFFCEDHNFQDFYRRPQDVIMRIPKVGIERAIMPDDSIYTNMPEAEKIHSVYRSLWVSRMLQAVGVRIMPKLFGMNTEEDIRLFNSFIPKNVPFLALQLQTVDEDDPASVNQVRLNADFIREEIKPRKMLFYAGMQGIRAIKNLDFGVSEENTLTVTSHMMLRSFHYDIRKHMRTREMDEKGIEEDLDTPVHYAVQGASQGHMMPKG